MVDPRRAHKKAAKGHSQQRYTSQIYITVKTRISYGRS